MMRCFSLLPVLLLCAPVSAGDRPNVILVVTDDQGYADLGALAWRDDVRTPNLDRLAREGVLFTDGYVENDVQWDHTAPLLWLITHNKNFVPPVGQSVTMKGD